MDYLLLRNVCTMRRLYLTQRQLDECLRRLDELNISGDQYLTSKNGDLRAASQDAIRDAKDSGVNTDSDDVSVQFSADALKNNSGVYENLLFTKTKGEMLSEMCEGSKLVRRKPNGKWGVVSGKTGKFWNADYETKQDAEDGLKAYFANRK